MDEHDGIFMIVFFFPLKKNNNKNIYNCLVCFVYCDVCANVHL